MINLVLNEAKSYLGTTQGDGKHKDLINKYNSIEPVPVGYKMKYTDEWCAAFVTVIGDITGVSKYIGRECGVQRFIQIFKEKGIWKGLSRPRPGDIVVFDWEKNGWTDHIGFVESVNGNEITTIEGNTSRRVARRTYLWNEWRIAGYARPKFPSVETIPQSKKSIHDIASEVIQGKWSNGETRIRRLTDAGYNASVIQKEVDRRLLSDRNQRSNEEIAKEVIQGKWDNGNKRKQLLEDAGYNYSVIQNIVNKLVE